MSPKSGPRIPKYSVKSRRRRRWLKLAASAAGAIALLSACATMDRITGKTADSPSHFWTPPAAEERPPAPLPSPLIPAELQATGRAWTLSEIVDVGLANNPQTKEAYHAARAASAAVGISLGAYLPRIDASVNGTKQKAVFAGGRFIIDQTTLTPSAGLSLLLFDFGGREADVQAARRVLEAANWTQNAVCQDAILEIESVYYQYLSAKALLEAQEINRKGAQVDSDAANDRHQAGIATIADVLQAKTRLSTVDLQVMTTKGLIQTLHGALASSMGLPVDAAFEISDALPESIPFDSVTKQVDLAIKEAETQRPDLAAARAQVLAADAQVRKARSTFYPVFSLNGDIGRVYYKDNPVSNPFYSVSVSVSLPFVFGLQQYAVLAAKAEREAARDRVTALGRGVELQVWTSYYGLKTSEQKIGAAGDLLESAQASCDVALGRYKEGVGSILELLAAQTTLESARVEMVQAKSEWFLTLVQFTHATGTLSTSAGQALPPGPPKGDHRP